MPVSVATTYVPERGRYRETQAEVVDVRRADRVVRTDEVPVARDPCDAHALLLESGAALCAPNRVGKALVEELASELNGLQPEAGKVGREPLPLTCRVVVREGAEPRPRDIDRQGRERREGEAEVAGDERREARRGLEREPPVVADLRERACAFGEIDTTAARVDIAGPHPHVLDVDAPDKRAERA